VLPYLRAAGRAAEIFSVESRNNRRREKLIPFVRGLIDIVSATRSPI
jgi:hypothetical protein